VTQGRWPASDACEVLPVLDDSVVFRAAFENAPIGMALLQVNAERPNDLLQVNRAMCEITGYSEEHLKQTAFRDVVHADDLDAGREAIAKLIRGETGRSDVELRYVHADGHTVWVAAGISLLPAQAGGESYAIAQIQDVTVRRIAEERLAHQALHDSLTGLPNRRSLFSDLESRLPEASGDRPLLLLLFDLNGFKAYNDTFGHPAGDALLVRVGNRLRSALDGEATAYRIGGDEFCVLAWSDGNGSDSLANVAAGALTEHGREFDVTASHGAVLLPREARTVDEAVRIADRRMYARKNFDSRSSAGRQSANVLLKILSERSPSLGVHLTRVTTLCEAVANKVDLPQEEVAPLLQAASLHDVGKAAIPDEILLKPGVLDDEEWDFIRRHTLIGERILAEAPALARAAKLVRWSHERFDGEGYPDSLGDREIPLAARIIAVCDAYDAMLSDRPYRSARESDAALEELRRCAGAQFDPEVVEAFAEVLLEREPEPTEAIPLPA
jgi:diguanylate cyclase (GGDEF)-like protein/PAS domain S-box-containing protein